MVSQFDTPLELQHRNVANSAHWAFALDLQRVIQLQAKTPGFEDIRASYVLRKVLQALVVSIHNTPRVHLFMDEHCRLFTTLIFAFCGQQRLTPDFLPDHDIILAFTLALLEVNPRRVPTFAFGYLKILGTPLFIPTLLKRTRGWYLLLRLLTPLLSFLGHVSVFDVDLRALELFNSATFRLLTVISHDFPAFLSEFGSVMCALLPQKCFQLRNLILAATPPDTPNVDPTKIDFRRPMEADLCAPPRIFEDWSGRLFTDGTYDTLKAYYQNDDEHKLAQVRQSLLLVPVNLDISVDSAECVLHQAVLTEGCKYDKSLVHAIIMDTVTNISSEPATCAWSEFSELALKTPSIKLILYLLNNIERDGQEVIIQEFFDQLRYPNLHTVICGRLLLWLTAQEDDPEAAQQRKSIIMRCMEHRLSAPRPQPWGLLALKESFNRADSTART